jgi:hypothetical protein
LPSASGSAIKRINGWREGPPVTVFLAKFRSAGRAFALRLNQLRTKKRIQLYPAARQLPLKHWPVIADNTPEAGAGTSNDRA